MSGGHIGQYSKVKVSGAALWCESLDIDGKITISNGGSVEAYWSVSVNDQSRLAIEVGGGSQLLVGDGIGNNTLDNDGTVRGYAPHVGRYLHANHSLHVGRGRHWSIIGWHMECGQPPVHRFSHRAGCVGHTRIDRLGRCAASLDWRLVDRLISRGKLSGNGKFHAARFHRHGGHRDRSERSREPSRTRPSRWRCLGMYRRRGLYRGRSGLPFVQHRPRRIGRTTGSASA